MLEGMLILWFVLTGLSLIFLISDLIYVTPAAPIMKWAWVLVILYTGPVGLFIYLLSCRQPLPGTHNQYIDKLWKQSIGSEVHCLAGDATGIIIAAIAVSFFTVSAPAEALIEYLAGFFFGWFIFQAFFMKNMMGGSYLHALKSTFMSEWLSMNLIMAGMIPTIMIWRHLDSSANDPANLSFWGAMSLASIIGGLLAFPMNRWLVKNRLKHGMVTAKPKGEHAHHAEHKAHEMPSVSKTKIFWIAILSLVVLTIGIVIALHYS